jgi:hypothetical protein
MTSFYQKIVIDKYQLCPKVVKFISKFKGSHSFYGESVDFCFRKKDAKKITKFLKDNYGDFDDTITVTIDEDDEIDYDAIENEFYNSNEWKEIIEN